MKIIDYMQEHKLSRADIAARLGCSPQYVSKILSGRTNFSFKSIAEIERCLAYTSWKLLLREVKDRDFLKEYSNDENYRL